LGGGNTTGLRVEGLEKRLAKGRKLVPAETKEKGMGARNTKWKEKCEGCS